MLDWQGTWAQTSTGSWPKELFKRFTIIFVKAPVLKKILYTTLAL
jgi:hypothetical protein